MAEELQFHSLDEIRAYIKTDLERKLALEQRKIAVWRLAKQSIWLLLLVAAYLQFFLIDIMYETITLPTLEVSVPVGTSLPKTRT